MLMEWKIPLKETPPHGQCVVVCTALNYKFSAFWDEVLGWFEWNASNPLEDDVVGWMEFSALPSVVEEQERRACHRAMGKRAERAEAEIFRLDSIDPYSVCDECPTRRFTVEEPCSVCGEPWPVNGKVEPSPRLSLCPTCAAKAINDLGQQPKKEPQNTEQGMSNSEGAK